MKYLRILISVSIIFSFNSYAGYIKIAACDAKHGTAAVVVAGVSGKWVGFSAKKINGDIVDVTPFKVKDFGITRSGTKMIHFNGSKDITEVRASSWKSYDKSSNQMKSRLDDTGWVRCK